MMPPFAHVGPLVVGVCVDDVVDVVDAIDELVLALDVLVVVVTGTHMPVPRSHCSPATNEPGWPPGQIESTPVRAQRSAVTSGPLSQPGLQSQQP